MKSRYNMTGFLSMPARLGTRFLQNVSPRMYRHDVFYDRDSDSDVDL